MNVIEQNYFKGCNKLTKITIPSSIGLIDGSSFSGSTSLNQITISSSVASIGYDTFKNCISLLIDFFNWPIKLIELLTKSF